MSRWTKATRPGLSFLVIASSYSIGDRTAGIQYEFRILRPGQPDKTFHIGQDAGSLILLLLALHDWEESND